MLVKKDTTRVGDEVLTGTSEIKSRSVIKSRVTSLETSKRYYEGYAERGGTSWSSADYYRQRAAELDPAEWEVCEVEIRVTKRFNASDLSEIQDPRSSEPILKESDAEATDAGGWDGIE